MIPGQGTYKNQPMTAWMSGATNQCFFPSLSPFLYLSKKSKTKTNLTHFFTHSLNNPFPSRVPCFFIGLPTLSAGNLTFILSPYVPLVSTRNLSTSAVSSISKIAFEYVCFLSSFSESLPHLIFQFFLRRAAFLLAGFPFSSPSSILLSNLFL